jgi:hypothetical protein
MKGLKGFWVIRQHLLGPRNTAQNLPTLHPSTPKPKNLSIRRIWLLTNLPNLISK